MRSVVTLSRTRLVVIDIHTGQHILRDASHRSLSDWWQAPVNSVHRLRHSAKLDLYSCHPRPPIPYFSSELGKLPETSAVMAKTPLPVRSRPRVPIATKPSFDSSCLSSKSGRVSSKSNPRSESSRAMNRGDNLHTVETNREKDKVRSDISTSIAPFGSESLDSDNVDAPAWLRQISRTNNWPMGPMQPQPEEQTLSGTDSSQTIGDCTCSNRLAQLKLESNLSESEPAKDSAIESVVETVSRATRQSASRSKWRAPSPGTSLVASKSQTLPRPSSSRTSNIGFATVRGRSQGSNPSLRGRGTGGKRTRGAHAISRRI
ncbi:unnamed protein product [Protopolystoma xenopodis]|uniref:Uncharacterized protein n=1 Tax=Protopolystoma xenopodis TaxID=117903 RepID=A0A448WFA8_9PLAT|nr:unnamed protein product [Protopolystoma xenopodis]